MSDPLELNWEDLPKTYIDMDELALRIAEACIFANRPPGKTTSEALAQIGEPAAGFHRAALAAARYIADCVNQNYPGTVEVSEIALPHAGKIPS